MKRRRDYKENFGSNNQNSNSNNQRLVKYEGIIFIGFIHPLNIEKLK